MADMFGELVAYQFGRAHECNDAYSSVSRQDCLTKEFTVVHSFFTDPYENPLIPGSDEYNKVYDYIELNLLMDENNNDYGLEVLGRCSFLERIVGTRAYDECLKNQILHGDGKDRLKVLVAQDELDPSVLSQSGVVCEDIYSRVKGADTVCIVPWKYHPEYEPPTPSDPGEAQTFGDPHMLTFDNRFLSVQSVGEFVLARSTEDDFEVQARFAEINDTLSANAALAMNVAGDRVGLYARDGEPPQIRVNGEVVNFGSGELFSYRLPNGGSVSLGGGMAGVVWPTGEVVQARLVQQGSGFAALVGNVNVLVPLERSGKMEGLLGNYDGDPGNDLRTRGGTLLFDPSPAKLHLEFVHSWRVSQSESLFDYEAGESTATFTDLEAPRGYITPEDLEPSVRDNAESICEGEGIQDPRILAACILDVGATGDDIWAVVAADIDPMLKSVSVYPLTFVVEQGESIVLGGLASGPNK